MGGRRPLCASTLEAWLRLYDEHAAAIAPLLTETYGADAAPGWRVDWRLFFLACAETLAYDGDRAVGRVALSAGADPRP